MDSFNFEIVLNYAMDTLSIKPPTSYNSLVEISKEKYDLTIVNKLIYYDEGEEIKIKNDTDYFNLFNYVEKNDLKEIDIIIKSDECKSKRKKSMRKRSSAMKPPVSNKNITLDDGCINDNNELDIDGDTRNLKFGMEDGRWSNQSHNQGELRRIYYIKEKKDMQRAKQMEEENQIEEIDEDAEENSNHRKRKLKSDKKINKPLDENNSSYEIEEQEDEKSKKGKKGNFYKNKKK